MVDRWERGGGGIVGGEVLGIGWGGRWDGAGRGDIEKGGGKRGERDGRDVGRVY